MRNNGGAGEDREIEKKIDKEMEFNQEYIQHFAHKQHILKLLMCNGQCCMICDERIYGPSYACASPSCKFYLYKSCGELQREVHHPLHHAHRLKLQEPFIK